MLTIKCIKCTNEVGTNILFILEPFNVGPFPFKKGKCPHCGFEILAAEE